MEEGIESPKKVEKLAENPENKFKKLNKHIFDIPIEIYTQI